MSIQQSAHLLRGRRRLPWRSSCGVFGWATLSEISGAVIAPGKLVVDTNVKKVQHPTGGVVGDLNVKDGDRVKKGDIVVRLDETAGPHQSRHRHQGARRDGCASGPPRGRARRRRKGHLPAPSSRRCNEPEVDASIASEQRLFELRRSAREGQKAQLLEQIDQLREQIHGNDGTGGRKSKEIDWNQQELGGIRGLWKQNLVPFNR